MSYRKNWIAMVVVILGLLMFIPVAQAERQDYEIVECGTYTYNVVHFSPEMTILSFDKKSIQQSTHENKLFDNWTGHTVGVITGMSGKWSSHSFSKKMGPDGEFIVWEVYDDPESGITGKLIYGSGKWKGIKGETKGKKITTGKPIVQGTDQSCFKFVGWIELPQ